jgi:hypothetical protein
MPEDIADQENKDTEVKDGDVSNEKAAEVAAAEAAAKAEADAKVAADQKAADEKSAADAEAKAKEDADAEEDDTEDNTDEHDPEVWGERFGDASIDSAIDLMKESGVKPEEMAKLFSKAIETGNPDDVDMDALVKSVGKAKADMVMIGVKDWHGRENARVQGILKEVHTAAGGPKAWDKVSEWVRGGGIGDDALMSDYRDMIDAGGAKAKFAAGEIMKAYEAENGSIDPSLLSGDGDMATDTSPLTAKEYHKLVAEAHAKNDTAEITRIKARRAAGRASGI